MSTLKIIALGDVVGEPGRSIVKSRLPELKKKYAYDFLIINGENSAGGKGITPTIAEEIFSYGADVITLGDHTWDQKEISEYLPKHPDKIIRPANFPLILPGRGWTVQEKGGVRIGVLNLIGRVFMNGLFDCPFRKADELIKTELKDCAVIILDMHTEATSEKYAMARYLDGRVSLVFGTHTHVPTADEQIFPQGTGYITDIGMCGSYGGVIGMDSQVAIDRFLGQHKNYKTVHGEEKVSGVYAEISTATRKTLKIERFLF